jgi:hypothetical protein
MARSHVNSVADLKIVNGSPIIRENKLFGRIQLELGYQQHAVAYLKR